MGRSRWAALLLALTVLIAATGCSKPATQDPNPLQAENDQLKRQVSELQGRVADLQSKSGPSTVNLIDPHYPPAVGGTKGWEYHKTVSADLDGDGVEEVVHVTNNAAWDPKTGEFSWDDGHPWHIYIEEPDGARTYVFSQWVQMSRVDVMVTDQEPTKLLILQRGGAGVVAYQVTYHGPGKFEAVRLLDVPVREGATFTDPTKYHDTIQAP